MAEFTENYSLIQPGAQDFYDVADFNENMAAIDGALGAQAAELAGVSEKIGTGDEGETIFSLLKAGGGSVIKSIQRFDLYVNNTEKTNSQAIDPVDPEKCIVLTDLLHDTTGGGINHNYTLTTNSLDFEFISGYNGTIKKKFQIVEFY